MESIFDKKDRLIQALCKQEIVANDREIASKLAEVVIRRKFKFGDIIFGQEDCTDEMYFVLSGKVSVKVNERTIAYRTKNQTVGEICLVDVGGKRSATVIVNEESELAKIEEMDFTKIANEHPTLWRNIAQSLACRLRERNGRERVRNLTPRVFIASSSEGKDVVHFIANNFINTPAELIAWTDRGLFKPSTHPIETLEKNLHEVDFAIIVVSPDDVTESRNKEQDAPRDNVVFEMGLFMGGLGRERVFILESTKTKIKIPSDLNGLTTMRYKDTDELRQICNQVEEHIRDYGTI